MGLSASRSPYANGDYGHGAIAFGRGVSDWFANRARQQSHEGSNPWHPMGTATPPLPPYKSPTGVMQPEPGMMTGVQGQRADFRDARQEWRDARPARDPSNPDAYHTDLQGWRQDRPHWNDFYATPPGNTGIVPPHKPQYAPDQQMLDAYRAMYGGRIG